MEFSDFTNEGISDFYRHIIQLSPIRYFYLSDIYIYKTFRGKPKRKTFGSWGNAIPFTGAGACGYDSVVEKVYFSLLYRNINYKISFNKKGLYIRGIVASDDRTGGYKIIWRK